MGMPVAMCEKCGFEFLPHTFKGDKCPVCELADVREQVASGLEIQHPFGIRMWAMGYGLFIVEDPHAPDFESAWAVLDTPPAVTVPDTDEGYDDWWHKMDSSIVEVDRRVLAILAREVAGIECLINEADPE